jgi:hypothetical protein
MIVACLDSYTFFREQLNTCNIAFVGENGQLIPFDTYYGEGEASKLLTLGTEVSATPGAPVPASM